MKTHAILKQTAQGLEKPCAVRTRYLLGRLPEQSVAKRADVIIETGVAPIRAAAVRAHHEAIPRAAADFGLLRLHRALATFAAGCFYFFTFFIVWHIVLSFCLWFLFLFCPGWAKTVSS